MINRITVSEKRGLFPERLNLGTIGEQNATELVFVLPVSLQGYSTELVCETSKGSFVYTVENNRFLLPQELLTDSTLNIQLVLKDGESVIWKSVPCTFLLNSALDDSGDNIIDTAKKQARMEAQRPLSIFVNCLDEKIKELKK